MTHSRIVQIRSARPAAIAGVRLRLQSLVVALIKRRDMPTEMIVIHREMRTSLFRTIGKTTKRGISAHAERIAILACHSGELASPTIPLAGLGVDL